MQNLSSLTNLLVSFFVVIAGGRWLRSFYQKYEGQDRYIFHSYFCWWLSWIVWVFAWGVITFTKLDVHEKRWVLAFSDLNALLLITLYFNLTRGNKYKPTLALLDFGYLAIVLGAGYLIFLLVLPERFDNLQEGWGLCLSAVSTLLVGWAFRFRYKTQLILIVGFVYAFSQPFVFNVLVQRDSAAITGAIELAVALLKIIWATAVTAFFTQPPVTSENIEVDWTKGVLMPPLKTLPMSFFIQTVMLLVGGIVLALIQSISQAPQMTEKYTLPILGGLAALAAIATILYKAFAYLKKNVRQDESDEKLAT